ncbi:hypothetical protein I4U23_026064 [Adineta vaga]|nr:hypothetical protein I4U23_026064 [Adineta vaga]
MFRLYEFILLIGCIFLTEYTVQGTMYSCNTTAPCGCSQSKVNINARIVGGEPAVSHSWGWAVSIRRQSTRHFCGGSILSSHYILTAAHCVDGVYLSSTELTVAVGTDSLYDNEGQRIIVSKIYMHPQYNAYTKENDIAILKLKKSISFGNKNIAKLCLPSLSGIDGTSFPWTKSKLVAIGWGHTTTGGVASNVLQQVTVNAVGNQERKCSNSIKNTNLQFCAAVNGGGKDTCQGDSGGPLMFYSEVYQQWMLAGITSYGRGCGLSDYAGIYTRVTAYDNWIKSIVGTDGVVTVGENSGHMNNMSNIFYLGLFACIVFIRSF